MGAWVFLEVGANVMELCSKVRQLGSNDIGTFSDLIESRRFNLRFSIISSRSSLNQVCLAFSVREFDVMFSTSLSCFKTRAVFLCFPRIVTASACGVAVEAHLLQLRLEFARVKVQ